MKKFLLLLLLLPTVVQAQHTWTIPGNAVKVSWLASSEQDLAYYNVYANGVRIFSTEQVFTPALNPALAWYYTKVQIYVTAVDTAGNESLPSELVWTILCQDTSQILGDINRNGMAEVVDYAAVLWKGGTPVTSLELERSDLDGDGFISVLDLAILKAKIGSTGK